MFTTDKEQRILNSHKRKEMLSLYRSLLSQISKINLISLQVDVSACFTNEFQFRVTVYNSADSNNGTFNAYPFQDMAAIKNDSILVVAAIKTDSFGEFDKVLKEISNKNYPQVGFLI